MIAAAVTTSKAAGAVHLDTMPLGVEALRGRRFRSLRDGQEWVVTTVDNRGTVYFVGADGVGKKRSVAASSLNLCASRRASPT